MSDEHNARTAHDALLAAAAAAGSAPSIHNTQPWRWVVESTTMQLYAEPARQLRALDPDGRLLLLSCGAALHHARLALEAQGWRCEVERIAAEPIARLTTTEHHPADPQAMRHFQATLVRRTDRRPVADEPVAPAVLDLLTATARPHGTRLQLLRGDQVALLAVAVEHAQAAEAADPRQRAELAEWAGGARQRPLGVPDSAIPNRPTETTVAGREFGHDGTLPIGAGHDRAASYALLWGDTDERVDWLRAGEALSAVWLTATEHGLTVLPLSAPVEMTATRQSLRRLLGNLGYPYLPLRIGVGDPEHAGPPHTPRLDAAQVVEDRH